MKGIGIDQSLKTLDDEQLDSVHESTLEILEGTGVRFDSEEAVQRLLDGELCPVSRDVVIFPRHVIEDSVPLSVKTPALDLEI